MRRPKARPRSCACGRKQWLGHGSIKRLQMRFQQEKQETQIHKIPSSGPLFPKTWRCGRLLFGSHFWVAKMAQKRGLKVTHFKQKQKESVLNKCQVVQFLGPFLGPISGPRNGSKIGPLFYRKMFQKLWNCTPPDVEPLLDKFANGPYLIRIPA